MCSVLTRFSLTEKLVHKIMSLLLTCAQAGGYRLPFFFSVSSPKRRMYVLYKQAIIWILPVFSTIEKKVEKKVSLPISPFSEHKRWKLFSHLFWLPDLFMNSCGM
jgi:hypothetical protein